MITEALLNIVFGPVTWILGMLPDWSPGPELVNLDTSVNGWFDQFAGIGVWVPWPIVGTAIAAVLAAALFNVVARLVLWIYSLVPVFGGGS